MTCCEESLFHEIIMGKKYLLQCAKEIFGKKDDTKSES